MSRVITFSTKFPSHHPRKGEPTHFVQKILGGLVAPDFRPATDIGYPLKFHTIRKGNNWKVGDNFSPRFWGTDVNPKSGRSGPYHSKQKNICGDLMVKKTWDFEIIPRPLGTVEFLIDGIFIDSKTLSEIIKNDGLNEHDFYHWFKLQPKYGDVKQFEGQIICWNENINY